MKLMEESSSKNATKSVENFLTERKVRALSKGHKSRLVCLVLFAKDRTVGNRSEQRRSIFHFAKNGPFIVTFRVGWHASAAETPLSSRR